MPPVNPDRSEPRPLFLQLWWNAADWIRSAGNGAGMIASRYGAPREPSRDQPNQMLMRDPPKPVLQTPASAADAKAPERQGTVLIVICLMMFGVFIFDIFTPPDDVSICFIYAVLVSTSIFSYSRAAYLCAALSTILSGIGAFIQPPSEALSLGFFANRTIAVATQWLVAFLVITRKHAEAMMRAEYEAERAKVETSRRFMDVLTHEIGTSLTNIDGHAFRIKKLVASDDGGDLGARSDKIRSAVRHIEQVVRQVQTATEVDKIQVEPGEVNLRNLVTDIVLESGSDSRIQVDTSALPSVVWGSAEMLQQAVANLISNALKYSPPDSIVTVVGDADRSQARITVSDRGRGIPEEEVEKLFEPYYRASNSRGIHGTGIGLYVVDRYVRSHGGSIEVKSQLGAGTTVTMRIPIGQS